MLLLEELRASIAEVRETGGFLFRFGLLLGCLALAAVNTGNNLLYLIFSIMIAVAVVAFALTEWSLRRLRARLQIPEEVIAGRPFLLGLEATASEGKFPAPWARATVRGLPDPVAPLSIPAMAPGGRAVVCATARISRRGVHTKLAVNLQSAYPFNLFSRGRLVRQESSVVVTPRRHSIRSLAVPSPASRGQVAASYPGEGIELFNIRDYTPEDDARRIDWKASARLDRPMLREFEREHERTLDVVLDERPVEGATPGAFDELVETAASLLDHCCDQGVRSRLIVGAENGGYEALEGRSAMVHLAGAEPRARRRPPLHGDGHGGFPRVVLSLDPRLRTPFEVEWGESEP
jgi:uncharacterized protein (DUF58 family)